MAKMHRSGASSFGLDQAPVHKKLFICVASLRNSFDLLLRFLHDFIVSHLSPQPRVVQRSTSYAFWVDLGVETGIAQLLSDLGLLWVNGSLVCAQDALADHNVVADAEHCFKGVLKLKAFSDSRWVTMGVSCRTLLAGRQLGLDELVGEVRAERQTSDYYIHGFSELDGGAKLYCAVSGLVCNVPDALLQTGRPLTTTSIACLSWMEVQSCTVLFQA